MGKLHKGAEPDTFTVAVMILHDWQCGKIPYFVPPPVAEGPVAAPVDEVSGLQPEQEISDIGVAAGFFDEEDMKPPVPSEGDALIVTTEPEDISPFLSFDEVAAAQSGGNDIEGPDHKLAKAEETKSSPKASLVESTQEVQTDTESRIGFIKAKKFEGSKEGYVFQQGNIGLGYYLDNKPEVNRSTIERMKVKIGKKMSKGQITVAEKKKKTREKRAATESALNQNVAAADAASSKYGKKQVKEKRMTTQKQMKEGTYYDTINTKGRKRSKKAPMEE